MSPEVVVWKQWGRMFPRASHFHLLCTRKLKLREKNIKLLICDVI